MIVEIAKHISNTNNSVPHSLFLVFSLSPEEEEEQSLSLLLPNY